MHSVWLATVTFQPFKGKEATTEADVFTSMSAADHWLRTVLRKRMMGCKCHHNLVETAYLTAADDGRVPDAVWDVVERFPRA